MSEDPSGIQVSVLGPLTVERAGQPVGLGGPRQRLVLALLVQAAPSVVSADRLIADVWGDAAPANRKGTLQTYISQLRSALGGGIVTSGSGYALDVPDDAIDAFRFENLVGEGRRRLDSKPGEAGELLREALAMWRGRPYADLLDEVCLRAEIVRLEELRVGAVEDRVAADLAIGAHAELVAELEVLTAQHPLRERFRAQQMLALYRAGRQADALRACQRTRDVLVEELGIDPSPELQDLEDRILRQDPSLLDDLGPHVERLVVLFTDIEDSTVLWELHPDTMPTVLAEHDRILNELISSNGGSVFKTTGDGMCAIFDGIVEAATAAVAIQRSLACIDWSDVEALRVRCAVDLGDVEARNGDYFGPVLNRCARLLAASHGGQILLSADAQAALVGSGEAGWSTRTLGEFRFKGLGRPQQVFQMQSEGLPHEFPPLRIDRLPPPLPGTAFGRSVRGYELRERIGGGDFGIVYRAYQPTVGREVAVKVIRPEYVDQPAFVRQFEAEAQLVAGLEHPHIVSLYDYWRDPDGAYLVMQWLRGGSLRRALDRGPFNADAALRLLDQICGALGYAHRQGVAHRDLKPGNVLLDDEGNAYLTDFGIAVRLVDASEGRRPQSTSPAYVPPEEIRGEPITVASDIYCLGLLTFELLTGRQPPMDGALPSIETIRPDLPAALAGVITRAIAEDPGDRHPSVSEFMADVRAGFGEAVVEDPVRFTATRNPYKGLRPFTETDAVDFHGRDQLIADLAAAVADHRLVAVVGPSGLGKSSVVRAGLIPALRAGAVPGSRQWLITTMFPGSHPFEELEAALVRIAEEWSAHAGEELRRDDRGLARVSKQIIPDNTTLLLVIDQFEELFTLTRAEATRQLFLASMAELAADERGRIRVVLTLRADHFDRPLRYPSFAKLVEQGLVTVSGLTDSELTDAITKPARGVGLTTEPGLEAHILADVHDQPAALPLLQYALTELFAGRHSDTLTIAGYTQTGGLLGAVSHRAEDLYTRLDESGRQMARQVFLRLVNVAEERRDTRRRVRRSELEGITYDPTTLDHILKTYGDHRLLSFDRDPESREPTVEVAHEALLSEWQRLRTWIDERRDDLVLHRRLVAAVDEWRASGQQPEYLLTGGRLDHFESFVGQTDLAIGRSEAEFLHASRRAAEASAVQRRKRRRQILTAFAAAAVISLILALVAYGAQQRAEDEALLARARDLASSAVLEAESDPALAMNLAVLAVEMLPEGEEPGPALELALRVAKSVDRSAGRYDDLGDGTWTNADLSPDGSSVAVAHGQQLVVFESAFMEAELWSYREPGPDALGSVAYSSDGEYIVASVVDERDRAFFLTAASGAGGAPDPRLLVFDANSGELVHTQAVEVEGACEAWAGPGSWRSDLGLLGLAVSGCDWNGLAFQFIDTTTWEVVYQHSETPSDLPGVVFAQEGTLVAMFSGFNTVPRSWLIDTADWSTVRELAYPQGALSPDGTVLAGVPQGPVPIVLEQAVTGVLIDRFHIGGSTGWGVAFSPAGDILAIGTFSESTLLFDPATGELIDTIQPVPATEIVLGENHLYIAGSGVVSKWNTTDVRPGDLNTVPLGLWVSANSILWTSDGTVVADVVDTTSGEWSLYPVDPSTGDLREPIHYGLGAWLAPLPGDRAVMFRVRELDSGVIEHGPLEVVDLSTGTYTVIAGCWMEEEAALAHEPCPNGEPNPAGQIAFWGTRDGTEFLILDPQETEAGETEVFASIWDTATFTETARLSLGVHESSFFYGSLLTEDYIVLQSDRDHVPQVHDRTTGELLLELDVSTSHIEHDRARGRIWMTGGTDSELWLLELDTLELRPVTGRVADEIRGVATSPSGDLVAVASADGYLRIYTDVGDLRHSIPIPNPADAWWLDEETLVVGTGNGPWTVITIDSDRLLATVKASLSRGFTDAECSLYEIDPCPTLEGLQGG